MSTENDAAEQHQFAAGTHWSQLSALAVGDHVMAGAGMRAELLTTWHAESPHAVVRWLLPDDVHGGWWGSHHSNVPWHTIKPLKENS